ncbi:MAG: excinuclease ABC subunit UvrA [Tenuifilaceae bacterium]|jgi:excinuclease ABC subunit A|nr:excinuclease ABC subunit UvrA [Bacteroidales bacterium]MDI9516572.1 excinuclease ABC subunit UvrA [Bacteroidota bacterium]OQC61810.1 MAG: UvrABC system protein A [Bacteroidetes bacterium ADurb.Bin008]HNV80520.1 excinuclease ABC subunit UvrA [Tenuifilaceae bacterium]MZP81131.1 excinuclease ABC subunit UvrA [Bacteroidales bacterium]
MAKNDRQAVISIKGAKIHNLKNISLDIPRDKLIVVSGLSGSGKSSLAFDTLYAEGQRRYVESLSAYARQFIGRISKPEVDSITGIPPAIAIEQKVNTYNPRSTVGTSTEIYDYLKLLFARAGETFSPISGVKVTRHSVSDVVDYIASFPEGTKQMILAPILLPESITLEEKLQALAAQGFIRIETNNRIIRIDTEEVQSLKGISNSEVRLLIDRLASSHNEDFLSRCADSVHTAFVEGNGTCIVAVYHDDEKTEMSFSNRFEADGIEFEEPSEHLFSFNNPLGACPTCEGYGKVIGIDENLVVPDKSLSVYDDAIACWKGESMSEYKKLFILHADRYNFPIHKPYHQLSVDQKQLLWQGNHGFVGLNDFFKHLEEKKYKIQYRVMLSRYMGKTLCPECKGRCLRKEAMYVKVSGKTLPELVEMPIDRLYTFFRELNISEYQKKVSTRIVREIQNRLSYLLNVGLSYLTLNRQSSTLSGGESQRINLATSLGSSLVGSLYILDEPSIGLHPRDTHLLIDVLRNLRDLNNTVVVVEHDEEIIRSADHIVDIGPLAGRHGGEIVFEGGQAELLKADKSLTSKYLTGIEKIETPTLRRVWTNYIEVRGARENNLKNLNVKFPLNCMVAVTGVSGSGKTSLVKSILYPSLLKKLNGYGERPGEHDGITGDIHLLKGVEMVDQNPIGKSSRSNPVTYIKAYDEIRKLFSDQPYSKRNGYKPSHFSFNVEGGRCEECQGEGVIRVEMQFMADVTLKCESCNGKRFKDDILEVKYKGKNIFDVLEMTVNQALEFFQGNDEKTSSRIRARLQPLQDVGLGYIKLGQSSSTLSGGESQRVKLAFFLQKEQATQPHLFIFDEPTTGLHFHDIKRLLESFNALINKGHSLLIVEHNLEIIKCADWIIDLGPEGGEKGGSIVAEGTPESVAASQNSITGKFLRPKIN